MRIAVVLLILSIGLPAAAGRSSKKTLRQINQTWSDHLKRKDIRLPRVPKIGSISSEEKANRRETAKLFQKTRDERREQARSESEYTALSGHRIQWELYYFWRM